MYRFFLQTHTQRGVSFIDVIVGVTLFTLVFIAVIGVFQLAISVIGHSKARVGGLALAQEQIEYIRSLSYDEVGTEGGIPAGDISQTSTSTVNNIEYTTKVLVQYVDDPQDGTGSDDENGITADYKRAKVTVEWAVGDDQKELFLVTNIVPNGIETTEGGGTLIVNVFDAVGVAVPDATVHIENPNTDPPVSIDIATNENGKVLFPGSPEAGGYKVTVSKSGHSSAQTYDTTTDNPNPDPTHASVIEGETTVASFQIDELSTKTVRTFSPIEEVTWSDAFDTSDNISLLQNVEVSGGGIQLTEDENGFATSGEVRSVDIADAGLDAWKEVAWGDSEPANTNIVYHIYADDTLIADSNLSGNSTGFTESPIDISGLSTSTYSSIQIGADVSTSDASTTPEILDWRVVYDAGPTPIADVPFSMRGSKTIGEDSNENPIYKYNENLATESNGSVTLSELEWDTYTITIDDGATGYDISESCTPQPRTIAPGVSETTRLLLVPNSNHTLLVAVKDENGDLIEGASVTLSRTGFNETGTTSDCGQAFFDELEEFRDYTLEVSASGYETDTINGVDISGDGTITVLLDTV